MTKEDFIEVTDESAPLQALKRLTAHVVRPGMCLLSDGGRKLSAGSDNSWISKIFICEWRIFFKE